MMNRRLLQFRYLSLVFASLVTGCSGGDVNIPITGPDIIPIPIPVPATSEFITTHGAITGLGDLTVNDVPYDASGATVTINGEPGTLSSLRHGQVVTVSGRISGNGWSGTASRVRFDANLVGTVENADASSDWLMAMGQPVIISSNTQLGAGIDRVTLAGLGTGSKIQVSGYADATGAIRATRIELDTSGAQHQVMGNVSNVDLANFLFTINRLTFDYSNAALIDLPGGAPANGMTLKAFGAKSGSLFVVERMVEVPALTGNAGQRVQTAGVITRFNSTNDFDINNITVASAGGATFVNGNASDLALNAELVVDGDFVSGSRIAAQQITLGTDAGLTAKRTYDLRDFTEISVPTVFNVTVTQADDFSVQVTVDADDLHRINVTQTGTRLNVALREGNGNIHTLEATITMPVLNRIDLTGVAYATLNDFNQAQMTVNVGGVSRLDGNALTIGNLDANVSGVSQLDFGDIRPIAYADIGVSGVSQATLNMGVGSTLTGSVSTGQGTGISRLYYYGTDVDVNVTTGSNSSLVRLGGTKF